MRIRTAVQADLKALAAVEALCFPPAEAAGEDTLAAVWPYIPITSGCWRTRGLW